MVHRTVSLLNRENLGHGQILCTTRRFGVRPGLCLELLTRRESEIVLLALDGWTAPRIAGPLHTSTRTVESHLTNAYRKLGSPQSLS